MPRTSEVYERLYHYTTWEGLVGILRSKTLWATHCRFLNDYSEITLFRDKLVSLLIPHVREVYEEKLRRTSHIQPRLSQEGGLDQSVQHDTELLVDTQYRATGDEIYIFSLCGQHGDSYLDRNGLLSQWRGYGAGGGYALVFNTQRLEEILEIERKRFGYLAMNLCDVVYSHDEGKLREELEPYLRAIIDCARIFFNRAVDGGRLSKEEFEDFSRSFGPFVNCITRYKHRGFSEENEVRAVVLRSVPDKASVDRVDVAGKSKFEKEIEFRWKDGHCVPYIELFDSTDVDLPIERIIVGPHKEKDARTTALRVMLRDTKIEVTCSDIPFVV